MGQRIHVNETICMMERAETRLSYAIEELKEDRLSTEAVDFNLRNAILTLQKAQKDLKLAA